MLVSATAQLRNFWYPVMPMDHLRSGPRQFVLLGEKIALWINEKGSPCAVLDRCPHRSAELSKGWITDGAITCPYHSWAFRQDGACVLFPQLSGKPIPQGYRVQAFHCTEKYGYAWVCLGNPRSDIPDQNNPQYRTFHCFYEEWKTAGLRIVENELDMAHFAVIHRGTFGDPDVP